MLRKVLLSCLLLSIALCTPLTASAITADSEPLPGSQVGIAYKLPNSNKVYGKNDHLFFHPASTQKVVTALAAMIYLGPDYEIKTNLAVRNNVVAANNKLHIDGSGTLIRMSLLSSQVTQPYVLTTTKACYLF